MQKRVLSVRRTAAALICAAALFPLTSCNGHTSSKEFGRSSPLAAGKVKVTVRPTGDRNGIEDLTAQQIYDKGRETNAAAGSYREQMTRVEAKTNLLVAVTECSGTVEMTGQGEYEVIVQGRDIWVRMDAGLARSVSEQGGVTVPEDIWLHGTPDHPLMAMVAGECRMDRFAESDTASAKLAAQLAKGHRSRSWMMASRSCRFRSKPTAPQSGGIRRPQESCTTSARTRHVRKGWTLRTAISAHP